MTDRRQSPGTAQVAISHIWFCNTTSAQTAQSTTAASAVSHRGTLVYWGLLGEGKICFFPRVSPHCHHRSTWTCASDIAAFTSELTGEGKLGLLCWTYPFQGLIPAPPRSHLLPIPPTNTKQEKIGCLRFNWPRQKISQTFSKIKLIWRKENRNARICPADYSLVTSGGGMKRCLYRVHHAYIQQWKVIRTVPQKVCLLIWKVSHCLIVRLKTFLTFKTLINKLSKYVP